MRNISFSHIHGNVTTNPAQLSEAEVTSSVNPGEKMSCIAFNCVGGATMENISLEDINLTFGGGGTAEDGARRKLPEIAGEYFMLGPMPAYGLYARGVHGLTVQNLRLRVSSPDLRPAVIFDNVTDAAVNGISVDGNPGAETVVRMIDSKQVLMTAPRLLTPAAVFLQVEGVGNERITIDGGDISYATKPTIFQDGALEKAVKLRD